MDYPWIDDQVRYVRWAAKIANGQGIEWWRAFIYSADLCARRKIDHELGVAVVAAEKWCVSDDGTEHLSGEEAALGLLFCAAELESRKI